MKKKIIYILLNCLIASAFSQDYNNNFKLSTGDYWGVSYHKLLTQEKGFAAKFNFEKDGWQMSTIRILYTPAFPATSSQWFFGYGYGVHIAYKSKIETTNLFTPYAPPTVHRGHFISPGIDGFLTLEYRFLKYPFVLSADYRNNFV